MAQTSKITNSLHGPTSGKARGAQLGSEISVKVTVNAYDELLVDYARNPVKQFRYFIGILCDYSSRRRI